MKIASTLVFAFIALITFSFYSQNSLAATFTNKDFLMLPDMQKKGWLDGVISTLGHVAFIKNESRGECVSAWYADDTGDKNALIIASMEEYPDHTPSTILIAILEKACGRFVRPE